MVLKCPCVTTFDPFAPKIGGVPRNLVKTIANGVAEQTGIDRDPRGFDRSSSFIVEGNLMGDVWGPHFDPAAPNGEGFVNPQGVVEPVN